MATISLEKRSAAAQIVLQKRGIAKPPVVRVAQALDISGSAQGLYESGEIQEVHERVMGIAQKFDDNGEVDTWTFTQNFDRVGTADVASYDSFIKKEILNNRNITKWGGTSYHPVIEDITKFFFEPGTPVKEKKGLLGRFFGGGSSAPEAAKDITTPAWVLFLTDGQIDRADQMRATAALQAASKHPIYWSMVGVGDARYFTYLEQVAGQLSNVGFLHLPDLHNLTDEFVYEQLITPELCSWLSAQK